MIKVEGSAWETMVAHAEAKYHSFRNGIDSHVFACLGEHEGCIRLMREISQKEGFLPGATWLAATDGFDQPVEYCGTIQGIRNHRRELAVPLVFSACFMAELAYGVLNIQATHNIGSLPGWYLWPVGGAMAMILTAGLGRATWLLILAMAAVDVYGASLMSRHYHTGLTWLWLIPLGAAILYSASGGLAEGLPSRNLSNQ